MSAVLILVIIIMSIVLVIPVENDDCMFSVDDVLSIVEDISEKELISLCSLYKKLLFHSYHCSYYIPYTYILNL